MAKNNLYNKILRDYVKKELKGGESKEDIRRKVIEKGYPESIVNEAMSHLDNTKKYVYFSIFAVIVLATIFSVFFVANKNQIPPLNVTYDYTKLLAEANATFTSCKSEVQNRCIAISNKNPSLCNNINNINSAKDLKEKCLEIVPLIIYYADKINSDKCKTVSTDYFQMSEKEVRDNCLKVLEAIDSNNENLCSEGACSYGYNIMKAGNDRNISECNNIKDTTAVGDCKMLISSDINYCDYSICQDSYNKFIEEGSNHTLKI